MNYKKGGSRVSSEIIKSKSRSRSRSINNRNNNKMSEGVHLVCTDIHNKKHKINKDKFLASVNKMFDSSEFKEKYPYFEGMTLDSDKYSSICDKNNNDVYKIFEDVKEQYVKKDDDKNKRLLFLMIFIADFVEKLYRKKYKKSLLKKGYNIKSKGRTLSNNRRRTIKKKYRSRSTLSTIKEE